MRFQLFPISFIFHHNKIKLFFLCHLIFHISLHLSDFATTNQFERKTYFSYFYLIVLTRFFNSIFRLNLDFLFISCVWRCTSFHGIYATNIVWIRESIIDFQWIFVFKSNRIWLWSSFKKDFFFLWKFMVFNFVAGAKTFFDFIRLLGI